MASPRPYVVAASGEAAAAPAGSIPIDLYGAGGAGEAVDWADVTGKPTTFPPVVGTTATTAKAGNYTPPNATTSVKGLVNQAAAQANTAATDVAGLVTDFNALLAKFRTAGILA